MFEEREQSASPKRKRNDNPGYESTANPHVIALTTLRTASLTELYNSFPIEEFNLSIPSLFKKKEYICFIIKL